MGDYPGLTLREALSAFVRQRVEALSDLALEPTTKTRLSFSAQLTLKADERSRDTPSRPFPGHARALRSLSAACGGPDPWEHVTLLLPTAQRRLLQDGG